MIAKFTPLPVSMFILLMLVSCGISQNKKEVDREAIPVTNLKKQPADRVFVDIQCTLSNGKRTRPVGTGGILVDKKGFVLVTDVSRIYPTQEDRKKRNLYIVDKEYRVTVDKNKYTASFYAWNKKLNLGLLKINNFPDKKEFHFVEFQDMGNVKSGQQYLWFIHRKESTPVTLKVVNVDRSNKVPEITTQPPIRKLDIHLVANKNGAPVGITSAENPDRIGFGGLATYRGSPRMLPAEVFKQFLRNPKPYRVNEETSSTSEGKKGGSESEKGKEEESSGKEKREVW